MCLAGSAARVPRARAGAGGCGRGGRPGGGGVGGGGGEGRGSGRRAHACHSAWIAPALSRRPRAPPAADACRIEREGRRGGERAPRGAAAMAAPAGARPSVATPAPAALRAAREAAAAELAALRAREAAALARASEAMNAAAASTGASTGGVQPLAAAATPVPTPAEWAFRSGYGSGGPHAHGSAYAARAGSYSTPPSMLIPAPVHPPATWAHDDATVPAATVSAYVGAAAAAVEADTGPGEHAEACVPFRSNDGASTPAGRAAALSFWHEQTERARTQLQELSEAELRTALTGAGALDAHDNSGMNASAAPSASTTKGRAGYAEVTRREEALRAELAALRAEIASLRDENASLRAKMGAASDATKPPAYVEANVREAAASTCAAKPVGAAAARELVNAALAPASGTGQPRAEQGALLEQLIGLLPSTAPDDELCTDADGSDDGEGVDEVRLLPA